MKVLLLCFVFGFSAAYPQQRFVEEPPRDRFQSAQHRFQDLPQRFVEEPPRERFQDLPQRFVEEPPRERFQEPPQRFVEEPPRHRFQGPSLEQFVENQPILAEDEQEILPPTPYSFQHSTRDDNTTNYQLREETGDVEGIITGRYSYVRPDGIKMTVHYRAGPLIGYQATIEEAPTDIVIKPPPPRKDRKPVAREFVDNSVVAGRPF